MWCQYGGFTGGSRVVIPGSVTVLTLASQGCHQGVLLHGVLFMPVFAIGLLS